MKIIPSLFLLQLLSSQFLSARLFVLLLFTQGAVLVATEGTALGQTPPPSAPSDSAPSPTPPGDASSSREARRQARQAMIDTLPGLTDDQKAKIAEIRSDSTIDWRTRHSEIEAVLTKDQRIELAKRVKQWRMDHPEDGMHHGPGDGNPPPPASAPPANP